uniref:Uncharacterized protein n=1 Tax=Rhizophora mucronata TaxID=61149 RepID=A0A2P2P1C7_RHIMU
MACQFYRVQNCQHIPKSNCVVSHGNSDSVGMSSFACADVLYLERLLVVLTHVTLSRNN